MSYECGDRIFAELSTFGRWPGAGVTGAEAASVACPELPVAVSEATPSLWPDNVETVLSFEDFGDPRGC